MKHRLPLLLLAATAVTGCMDVSAPAPAGPDQEASFAAAKVDRLTSSMFQDYMAMGTSIAAGFISGGISGSTQVAAYPVLIADAAGARFRVPLLAEPGCPVPWVAPLTPATGAPSCAGRATPFLPPTINNVAVPGQILAEVLNQRGTEPLPALFLKGRTQVEAMLLSKPTFLTVHLGDNDAFRAALAGSLTQLTPLADFAESYAHVVDAMRSVNRLQGAALIGVTNPVAAMPLLQPGAFFFAARDAQGNFLGKPVNLNCSPVTALGQLNPLARNLVSYAIVPDVNFPEINCDPAAYALGDPRRGAYLLDVQEQQTISIRVAQFNAVIQQAAAANGWAFFDPNVIIAGAVAARDANGRANLIRKCQDLATATTAVQIQVAVLNSCPVPGPTGAPNLFGTLISFDGVHPSAAGHALLAAEVSRGIDMRYGTDIGGY
jgi:hypothetical protein